MFQGALGLMLFVSDIERSVGFYRDVLGFDFKGYWDEANRRVEPDYAKAGSPGYAELSVLGSGVGLHVRGEDTPPPGAVEGHLEVEDVEACHAKVVAAGGRATEPKLEPWGATLFTVTDPDGHRWAITSPVGG